MAYLYITPKGQQWHHHSYSAGNDFDGCPYRYYLRRIEGWKEKDTKAAFLFGRAVENAIQWHHEHDGTGAVETFVAEWQQHAANKDLKYTKTEKDWASLHRAGVEMLKLYVIKQPVLPIPMGGQTLFQQKAGKEVFPGDPNYGEIEDEGRLDIIAYVDPAHAMLPKLNWRPEYGPFRPIIVDIKTSGVDFPDQYGLAAYDTQLRRYSWLSGIRDVALLWFVKKSHNIESGSAVSLLADVPGFKAGDEMTVAYIQGPVKPTKKEPDKQPPLPLGIYLVKNESLIEDMKKAQGKKEDGDLDTTNEAKDRKYAWLKQFAVRVDESNITKQRLQFNAGYVTVESANDAGEIAGRQIISIVNAWKSKRYPNTFGVRFPHDDRSDPYFVAFVLGDEKFKNLNFVKKDEETIDDMFREEEPPDA